MTMAAEVMTENGDTLPVMQVVPRDLTTVSPRRMEGKVAIVTGGGRGIGEAITRLFARHGARVLIADIDDQAGETLAGSLSLRPQTLVSFLHCDVSLEADVQGAVDYAVSRFGRLDVLVNNAGILGNQKKKSIMDFDADEFDKIMQVNVRGVALGMKHAARVMAPRCSGCIVSMASVAGVMGGLGPHAYTASKHAIVGLTKNAACELGKYGIRVNCISPFGVSTSMLINAWRSEEVDGMDECIAGGVRVNPSEEEIQKMDAFVANLANLKGTNLKGKDIAEAAVYLASDESKYVSGHNLVVDGGVTTISNCIGL